MRSVPHREPADARADVPPSGLPGHGFDSEFIDDPWRTGCDRWKVSGGDRSAVATGIDLSAIVRYRTEHILTPTKTPPCGPPLRAVRDQFDAIEVGVQADAARLSARSALSELKKLRVAWPELEYDLVHGALVLKPSLSRIPKARSRLT